MRGLEQKCVCVLRFEMSFNSIVEDGLGRNVVFYCFFYLENQMDDGLKDDVCGHRTRKDMRGI